MSTKKIALVLLACVSVPLIAGSPAPSFRGKLLGGGRTSLRQSLQSDKGLLITFWASWCAPCLLELDKLTQVTKNDPSLPLNVLTINVDTSETASDVRPTIRTRKIPFKVILDPKHKIFAKYNREGTLPYSVLVGPSGEILKEFKGYYPAMFDDLKKALKQHG